jgi:hypothetical protein
MVLDLAQVAGWVLAASRSAKRGDTTRKKIPYGVRNDDFGKVNA